MQNIYDDPDFFTGYKQLRDTASGLNEVLEQPALRAMLPDLAGTSVLELGCGMGQFARWCVEQGASHVCGVDVSEKMLAVARRENALPQITYVRSAIEELRMPDMQFDLVVSSLALHYVEDYTAAAVNVHDWLKPRGVFLFSVEHPLCTASMSAQGWVKDEQGRKSCWAVDNYAEEGKRLQKWFVEGVVKYHRTVSTYLNVLIQAGFHIERIEEPEAIREAIKNRPDLTDESRRPPFLLIKARREG
jgi:ubiquinone/menaquinone biosynthesis C-methylase UbiE